MYSARTGQSPERQQPNEERCYAHVKTFEICYNSLRLLYFHLFEERRPQNISGLRLLEIKYSFGLLPTAKLCEKIFLGN